MKKKDICIGFPKDETKLYDEMVTFLQPLYSPTSFEDDDIHTLASEEFCRVREIICKKYDFDEDKYIKENVGTSPFDFVRDEIEQEVYSRIRKGQAITITSDAARMEWYTDGFQQAEHEYKDQVERLESALKDKEKAHKIEIERLKEKDINAFLECEGFDDFEREFNC